MIGFWEIVLIITVLIILFLPSFLRAKGELYAKLRLYAVIAVLLLIIFILTRFVFTLIGKMMALVTVLFILTVFFIARYLKRI